MTTLRCPCCGAPISQNTFLVDLNTMKAVVFGQTIQLSPREAEILSVLRDAHPRPVSRDRIASKVYGRTQYENSSQAGIVTTISRIRRRTGIKIVCRGRSYTMDLTGPEQSTITPLRRLRLSRNLSLRALAHAAGMSQTTLWEIEHGGTRKPTPRTIARLAAALQVPIQALYPMLERRPSLSTPREKALANVD